jgi:hypothetical protein
MRKCRKWIKPARESARELKGKCRNCEGNARGDVVNGRYENEFAKSDVNLRKVFAEFGKIMQTI